MRVVFKDEPPTRPGFITWERLATEIFPAGKEIKPGEQIISFEIGDRGINYFVSTPSASQQHDRVCQKCGCLTKGEEALVDGKILCHPCADSIDTLHDDRQQGE